MDHEQQRDRTEEQYWAAWCPECEESPCRRACLAHQDSARAQHGTAASAGAASWTVIGLRNTHTAELLVAGVIPGEHGCRDTDHHADEHGTWQRVAYFYDAADADEAAALAIRDVETAPHELAT